MFKKLIIIIAVLVLSTFILGAVPAQATPPPAPVFVYYLVPNWTLPGGGGVFSAYIGPPAYDYVSPGSTQLYDGREAGIIKAGLNVDSDGHYWDEGLFAFKPNVTINDFASMPLTYDVENQYGENPVWMTIEIDTGVVGDRNDNTIYQFVPPHYASGWHTIDAGAGEWQKWNNNNGDVTGNPKISLADIAVANTGLNVVRAYLRLGMGDSYHGAAGLGTVAWVDKATIGGVTYDFAVLQPGQAVPELPAGALLGLSLAGLVVFIIIQRNRKAVVAH
jgi:hypothetical protein